MAKTDDIEFGINWTQKAKQWKRKDVPRMLRLQYCAYWGDCEADLFDVRKERVQLLWPNYQFHRWNERRLRAVCDYHWVTWIGPGASGKTVDAAVFGLEYWLQAPDRTAVIVCSTTMKMLRMRIWSYITHYHQSINTEGGKNYSGELLDSTTRVRWRQGDDKNGIFGMAVEEGPVEEVINNLIGIHTERVLLILDEGQGIREAILRATKNMAKNPRFDFQMMGNPDSIHSPLVRESEPIDGWDSVVRAETEEWETLGGPLAGNGLCQFFDGRKSPADDSPEEAKRLPWLINKDWVANHLKSVRGNLNDPSFWSQAIGWPPPMGLESTLLSDAETITFRCRDKAVWTEGYRQCAALDPAFNGGDKMILQFIKYGQAEDPNGKKRWVIEFGEWLLVTIDADSSRPEHYQIMDFCRAECVKRRILPREFALDSSGEGGGLKSIFDQQWGLVNGVEAGGYPSDDIPIDETGKTAREAYDTRASELLFAFREFAIADGIRGLSNEASFQACARRTFFANKKWCAEPKVGGKGRKDEKGREVKGYRQRMGHSPDHLDACCVGVEYCRRIGGAVPTVTYAPSTEPELPYEDEFSDANYLKGYSYV
jgi:hypothetical protein